MIISRIEGEVYTRSAHLPELRGTPYHRYIDVHQPILTGDRRKIIKLGDALNASKLSFGHAWEISHASSNAYQGDTKKIDTMGLSLPSSDTPLNPPGPVSGTQAAQISQPALSIPGKGKIERHSILDPIPIHKAHQLISSDNAQVTIEPQL